MSIRVETANSNTMNKRNNSVVKGAKIGAGAAIGLAGAGCLSYSHEFKKVMGDGFLKTFNKELNIAVEACGDKKLKAKVIASYAIASTIVAAGIASIGAVIGAGIGKLVKNHNEKKEAEKQEIIEQVKTELLKGQE